ncbi:MAG: hypothetical protein Q4A17_07365, partial [Thermoguttaceae bacterium]|nr:hypothetical protein [Thermoguttaceae bacterium]
PEVKPEVKITLKSAEDPKPLPKIKKDHEVSLHKKAIDESSSLACKTSLFMGLPDITPKSKEQAVNSFRIVKCLAHCFQWLGNVLENQENKKRITECSSCIVKLCKIANKISNLELSKISVECKAFIEQEINPKWPVPELKSSETVDVAELSQIEKKIANQLKKSGPLETELEVWNRLAKQIKSLKNARKISQDSLKSIQRDIYTLFQDFHVKPDNSRICNLIQQIQSRLTGKLDISYEMSLILDAIEDQQIEKEFAACSEQELKDKYQNDPNIQKLRQFFRDKILVIAGGTPKKEQKECFAKAFQCEIDWVETNHSQPLDHFIDAIKNERVGALLTLQDKASHKHSLELYTMAKKEGKKLFRIAHMNPILIAYKMMKQFSDNLQ